MIRIGICDDIYDARLVLRAQLETILENNGWNGDFREFSSGEGLLTWLKKHAGELDVIFLDIEMGTLNGMDTARQLRAADKDLQLVFVSAYADHVFDGYSVGAAAYLLKPTKIDQLTEVLQRVHNALEHASVRTYICQNGDTRYRIPLNNILYFTSDRRKIICVTSERNYTFYNKLDTVAMALKDDFVRIHQRYLVRCDAICRIEGTDVVLKNDVHLPISRSCRKEALLTLARSELEE